MYQMCLLGMLICSLLTGTSGVDDTHVFSTSDENARLPCNNTLSDCTSTTWNHNRRSETVELVAGGKTKENIERRESLNVGSDCSLNIKKVTQEDYGSYTCQQFVNGNKQGTDARVYLHFLQVSSSSSQSEIRPGSSLTLSCQLYYYGVPCDTLVRTEGIELIWVNQAGVSVMTDSRYQISFSSTHCISNLTTTLLNEDHNREWRCQVTQRNQLKTSASFTVKYSAQTETLPPATSSKTTTTVNKVTSTQGSKGTSTAPILATTPNSDETTRPTPPKPTEELVIVIAVVSAALAILLPAIICWVLCKKRGDNRRGTNDSVVTDINKYKGTNDAINISLRPPVSTNEQIDVTYTEIAAYRKNQGTENKVHGDDKVTYAFIRGAPAGPQDDYSQLYASVNKNGHK